MSDNPLDFSGIHVIVTGGTRGIGRGISEAFLRAGARVLVCARSEPESLPRSGPNEALFYPCDVRDWQQIAACVDYAASTFGAIDVLVNNAGGTPHCPADSASPRFSEAVIALNLTAPLHFAQLANRYMQAQSGGGSIINIASVSATRASPGTAAYGAAKAGLVSLGSSLAVEWAPLVRVNSVIAGLVETEQSHLHYGDETGLAAVAATVPLARLARPHDIASSCLFLASPLASYISGAQLTVHGGGEAPRFLAAAGKAS